MRRHVVVFSRPQRPVVCCTRSAARPAASRRTLRASLVSATTRRSSACTCSAATIRGAWSCRRRRPSTTRTRRRARTSRSLATGCCRSRRSIRCRSATVCTRCCRRCKTRFETGQCAFIANVGPLIAPLTRDDYLSGSPSSPPQLFSHNEQQNQWYTLRGRGQSSTGWAGRLADLLVGQVSGQQLPVNLSLSGNILMQSARSRRGRT